MRLSIIIPVYNVEKYIAKCLDSILDQNLPAKEYEIIIVNDGSTDGSLRVIKNYAKVNETIKVFDKENGGAGSARNYGVHYARGNYIYFIDPDDYLTSTCLNKMLDTCEDYNLDILTFLSTPFFSSPSKDESISEIINPNVLFDDDFFSSITSGEDYIANFGYRNEVWWYVINREFLKNSKINFIEGRWLEDATFTLELFLAAKRMAHLKLDVHRYRRTPGSAMRSMEPKHYLQIIRDMHTAATGYDPIIKTLSNKTTNPDCIARIKAKQQSLVFFSMMRMLKSTMGFDEVKQRMNEMIAIKAYPLDSLLGEDYNGITYQLLVSLFKTQSRFYFFFKLANPVFKFRNKFLN